MRENADAAVVGAVALGAFLVDTIKTWMPEYWIKHA